MNVPVSISKEPFPYFSVRDLARVVSSFSNSARAFFNIVSDSSNLSWLILSCPNWTVALLNLDCKVLNLVISSFVICTGPFFKSEGEGIFCSVVITFIIN